MKMVVGEKQEEILLEEKTESLDRDAKTLNEASRGFGLSEDEFNGVLDGKECVGGGEGVLEDSELNGVSSLLKMKGESNVNGEEKVSKPIDSLLSVVEEKKEMEVKNGGDVDAVDINGDTEKIDENEKTDLGDKMDGDGAADMNCEFSVGDFVWGKIKSHPWWPGQIYDPNDASDKAEKAKQKGRLLVAYFGDGTFAWCHPSQLKPFEENFEEVSKHSNSKNFLNAVEAAVDAISRLVEVKMTCSCVSKEKSSEFERPLGDNAGIKGDVCVPDGTIGKLSIGLFEPGEFLRNLKLVAQVVSMSSSLDSMVLKGWLSAFYRAKGFDKLPAYEDPQDVPGLEENAGTLVVDISDYNNGMNVSFQGPKFGQNGESLMNIPDVSGDTVPPGKQKSIAAIMEANVGPIVKNEDVVTRGTKSGKSASTTRRKRKGSDEAKADDVSNPVSIAVNKLENKPSGEVEANGNGVKEDTDKAHSFRGKQKKSKSFSSDNNDGEGRGNDAKIEEPVEKGALSRERKKSKYLSPPYTTPSGRGFNMASEAEFLKASKEASVNVVSTPLVVNSNSEPTKKQIAEELDENHNESNDAIQERLIDPLTVDAPTSQVLAEARSAALTPQYPKEHDFFDVAWEFLSVFRSSVYHDGASNKMFKQSQSQKKRKSRDSGKDQNQSALGSTERKSKQKKISDIPEVRLNDSESKQTPKPRGEKVPKKPKIMELAAVSDKKETAQDSIRKASSTALFVTFGPGSSLPSKDDLIKIYSKYGALNTEETDMFYPNFCARVVFTRKSDAKEALKSSLNVSPFPTAPASFEIRKMSTPRRQRTKTKEAAETAEKVPASEPSVDDASHLNYIRDKLKMLVSFLETSDDKMTPGVKSKLQGEMKELLEKVGATAVSSSS